MADVGRGLVYATARDITEQKLAEEQLREAKQMQEKLQHQLIIYPTAILFLTGLPPWLVSRLTGLAVVGEAVGERRCVRDLDHVPGLERSGRGASLDPPRGEPRVPKVRAYFQKVGAS